MTTILAIGKFIHKERKKQKLSLAKLSTKAFGNPYRASAIGEIEKANMPDVTFQTIDKLLIALGYSLKDLFLAN